MVTDITIKNKRLNIEVSYTAESYVINLEERYIIVYHSELGNVHVILDEHDEVFTEQRKTTEEIIQETVSACYHAYPDTFDDTVFCNAYGYSIGEGCAVCNTFPYKEKPLLDKDVKDVIAYLQTGNYRIVNNKIVTNNGYIIKRKGTN